MLKTISGHNTPFWIGRYLFYGPGGSGSFRPLDIDSRNIVNETAFWQEMDETRRLHGKFMKANKGKAREYYHFILSPDAADAATLEQVREMANRWVDENIGDGFQVVIVYHDDNSERSAKGEEGIVHAHIVVNSVDSATGAKLQIGSAGIGVDEIADSAQRIAAEVGLSAFDNADRSYKRCRDGARGGRPGKAVTKAEERIVSRGEDSFKDELRAVVDAHAPRSENVGTLQARVAPYGFGIVRASSGLVYIAPDGRRVGWKALGRSYGEEGLFASFQKVSFAAVEGASYASFAERYAVSAFAAARVDERLARLQATIDAYSVISREDVGGMEDFAARISGLREFGAARRKDLYIANKAVERLNAQARMLRGEAEVPAPDDGEAALLAAEIEEFGRDEWIARYRLEGEALLSAQADVDGAARRIDDLQKARDVAAEILGEVARRAEGERASFGGSYANPRPSAGPSAAPNGAAKPARSRRDGSPYWKLQIKREKYREIARTSREYRANLLAFERASDPSARMRPYATKSRQIAASIAAQRRWEAQRAAKKEER